MKKYYCLVTALIITGTTAFTSFSGLPSGTDVWLFTYEFRAGTYSIIAGTNISNHKGYDSQPSFSESGGYMLWTSERDSGQTEIYRYDVQGKVSTRITQTAVSEYSPTYMFGGKYISAVVVEKDSSQRLWKYHKSTAKSKILLPKVYGVGYHCWFDENTVFLFQLTDPVTLVQSDIRAGTSKIVTSNIGRCMSTYKTVKQKILLYTQRDAQDKMWIKAVDGLGVKMPDFTPIPCLEGSEDFAVDKRGYLMMGAGSKLYSWKIGESTEWILVADLSGFDIKSITRIAISPDGSRIALVDNNE
ncbi:MAG TPA: hypothetical protein VK826_13860 [Bacteroidia bacterium]|nr:hypothetical protein [Bacteroidia bacterium]